MIKRNIVFPAWLNNWDQAILFKLNAWDKNVPTFLNKFMAEYLVYIVPIALLYLWFWAKKSQKVAMRAFFAIILAWPIISLAIGKLINRPRPFETKGVQELLFHRPDYSFPSDHAAALFAMAFSFWFSGYKKLAYFFLGIAILVSFFRVATGIHWPSDIVAGAIVGLAAAWLIYILDKPLDIIYNFILKLGRKLKLA